MTAAGPRPTGVVVTIGTELTTGLRLDTNTAEVAEALTAHGIAVVETLSLPDDREAVVGELRRLVQVASIVVVTGGLGPTHDDVTRDAAAEALGLGMYPSEAITRGLATVVSRHADPEAAAQIVRQADVIDGATVLHATVGTAPGQVVPTPSGGRLVLLPGPPREMRPMLAEALTHVQPTERAATRVLKCVGLPESDIQVRVERALRGVGAEEAVGFTVLARPAEVHAVLTDETAGPEMLDVAVEATREAIGAACFSSDGATLPEVVVAEARDRTISISTAESCTGGLVAAALTDIAGASDVFLGSVVAYSDDVKERVLGVRHDLLLANGAVSQEVALAMARGGKDSLGADLTVAVTGIAGPGGAVPGKPVGTVWFAVADASGAEALLRNVTGDRSGVRERATTHALDLLRRRLIGLPLV